MSGIRFYLKHYIQQ